MQQEKSDETAPGVVAPATGQILLGRYRIVERIGRGSSGVVYRAYDSNKERDIAIKVIFPSRLSSEQARERFMAEARTACELFHPGVVKPTGVYSDDSYTFITSELLEGRTLRQVMDERRKARNPFSRQEVVAIVTSLIDILQYAHVRTVHRNLKPENIWVDGKNNYRIMDFGVAALVNTTSQNDNRPVAGMACYVAPEQWRGWLEVEREADQYALGALAYELLHGTISSRKINALRRRYKKVNRNISSVIAKMMAVDAADRFSSILLAKEALSSTESSTRSLLTNRTLRTLVLIAVIAVAALALVHSRDSLVEFWESVRPLSEAEKQLIFDDMIARANDVNRLERLLRRSGRELETAIRQIQNGIRELEDDLERATLETVQAELRQQLDQARVELARQQKLKSFTDQLVFTGTSLTQLDGKIRESFLLFEQGRHQRAIELIKPIQADLNRRLQQFDDAEIYLAKRERLIAAQLAWRQFNQSSGLQLPADIDQRVRAIAAAEHRAEAGDLAMAAGLFEEFTLAYEADHARDQQLVADRSSYLAQQAKTIELETELNRYLRRYSLKIDAAQSNALERARSEERERHARQDFSGAEASNRELAQTLRDYYATAQSAVAEARRKAAEEQARKAREARQKALAAAQQPLSGDSSDEAINRTTDTLPASPLPAAAGDGSLPRSLENYIPGLVLVEIPAGSFEMGSLNRSGERDEKPVRRVSVRRFAMMKHEVTFEQFDRYAELAGRRKPDDAGWGRGNRPVINVDWNEARAYAEWLSQSTGLIFRLPSESEWEYATRSGSTTIYSWGDTPSHDRANYGNEFCCSGLASGADQWVNTAPVGSFEPNDFGLGDMHGNVEEWVQDCWNDNYNGAPADASPRLSGHCSRRVVRGGSWSSESTNIRSANRNAGEITRRTSYTGFRLVLEP